MKNECAGAWETNGHFFGLKLNSDGVGFFTNKLLQTHFISMFTRLYNIGYRPA